MVVGVRELKARLSEYLARAQAGEEVVVTDRGRPVVRIVALAPPSMLDQGIEEGWIEPARRTGLDVSTRHRSTRAVLDVLDEDRR
jgi:prevent-host-death family protein